MRALLRWISSHCSQKCWICIDMQYKNISPVLWELPKQQHRGRTCRLLSLVAKPKQSGSSFSPVNLSLMLISQLAAVNHSAAAAAAVVSSISTGQMFFRAVILLAHFPKMNPKIIFGQEQQTEGVSQHTLQEVLEAGIWVWMWLNSSAERLNACKVLYRQIWMVEP